jgi:cellulose synthase/poly-beta-1,6-N-acetylglucosamine synthase-like glycosyltransferase
VIWLLLIILSSSLIGITIYSARLYYSICQAFRLYPFTPLESGEFLQSKNPQISVIIPAYNEIDNIEDCIISVLNSTKLSADNLEVWVVDDRSTDETLAIAQTLRTNLGDPRLKILAGKQRPQDQIWTGKNWACLQGATQAKGEFLLFIDADVRLKPGAIETVVQTAEPEKIDLLSFMPALVCGNLAEWLVQPLMFNNLLVAYNFGEVNNPKTKAAVAVGPFMLFRRSAYEKVGGHQAVASHVMEDVALAQRIKHSGLKLRYVLGADLAAVQMYPSWAALWEGWTKVVYIGANRNLFLIFTWVLLTLVIYPIPWLGLAVVFGKSLAIPLETADLVAIGFALVTILLQYDLRRVGGKIYNCSTRYWWLSGLGGLLLTAIAIASVIKTETGWGWTWRGRKLS